jgi:hypothetical protein
LTFSTANLDTRYVERLKAIDGIEEALPLIRHHLSGFRGVGFEQIDGVDWNTYARVNGINIVSGHGPEAMNEVVIDETKGTQRKSTRRRYARNHWHRRLSHRWHLLAGVRRAREDVA